ncbi:MAG: enoyl-CoA hydratase [Pseudomonadota bacterium]|jgi:enoyl-CoA hydratase/carnithine racemase|nr:enoyl-CoA hydratase [Pseudomonadota bacterium]|tara:strand:+ start:1365 stop:2165 length:801 start_codon:yes stop_codon:yes gene_type:complete
MSKTHSDAEDKVLLRHNARDIAWLTLNRPKAYNALSRDLMSELISSLNSIANERDIKVVVIKGAGKGFCAGHDLQEMKVNNNETFLENFFAQCCVLMQAIVNLPQPVIAQVHGTAAAAGCQLVASCDLAFADDKATFATPGVNIGLFCSTPMVAVSRKINRKKMMEMLLLGDKIDSKTAVEHGLINRRVPGKLLNEAVSEIANKIASKSPLTLKIGKEAFYKQLEMPLSEAYEYTSKVMIQNMQARDAEEGISAFIEKRLPVWTGK